MNPTLTIIERRIRRLRAAQSSSAALPLNTTIGTTPEWTKGGQLAARIRESGQILCAAMHPPKPGDTHVPDGLHNRLSAELKVLVTEPMHCDSGRRGHAYHGEWWWRDRIPADVEVDPFYGRDLAKRRAFRALPQTARPGRFVLGLDVVALGALIVVVVHLGSRLRGMKRRYLRHPSPPFTTKRWRAYRGT
jgi:hypothetical protein